MWRCICTMCQPFSSSTSIQHYLGCASNGPTHAWSGGSNPRLKTHESNTDQEDLVGTHDASIRCVEYCPEVNVVVTGPWDQTVKLWHPRTPCNAGTFCLWVIPSLSGDQLIVGKVGSKVLMWELQNMGYVQQCRVSNLKYQTCCLWTFSNKQLCIKLGWRPSGSWVLAPKPWGTEEACLSSVKENNIEQIYPVNAISFNNIYGMFAMGGSEGFVNIWGPVNKKQRHWFCM